MARLAVARTAATTELVAGIRSAAGVRSAIVIFAIVLALTSAVAVTMTRIGVPSQAGAEVLGGVIGTLFIAAFVWSPKPTLIVFVLFVLMVDTVSRYAGYRLNFVDEVGVPAMFVITAVRERPWRAGIIEPIRDGALITILVIGAAASITNNVPDHVWLPGLVLLAKIFAFFYVVVWQRFTIDDLRGFACIALAVTVPIIGLGFVEALNPSAFREFLRLSDAGAARGSLPSIKSITFHPVIYGWVAAWVAIGLAAYYVIYRRWWLLLGSLLAGAGAFLSARRRAIIGLIVGLAAGFVAHGVGRWRWSARRWAPVGASVLALVVLFSPGIATLFEITARDYVDPVTVSPPPAGGTPEPQRGEAARIVLYARSLDIARDYFPLGAGLGRYGSWMSRIEYSPLYAQYGIDHVYGLSPTQPFFITDAFWPQIVGETGFVGTAALLLFLAAVGIALWQATRIQLVPFAAAFCLGALMLYVHALVETSASPMFSTGKRTYIVLGVAGIAISLLRDAQGVRRTLPALDLASISSRLRQVARPITARPYASVALVLVGWAVLVIASRYWVSDFYVHMATVRALASDLVRPLDPMVGVAAGSAYFSPYTVGLAVAVRSLGVTPLTAFEVAAVLNFVLLLYAIWRFTRHLGPNRWIPVAALVSMGLLWGINSPTWSGFYDLGSVSFTLPYPSLLATALMLLAW
ncbi:MAG: O-antigen ligase family protein, partial [Chloroflexota bacterium]|nr:O-antigen ligase family protein [Chloroflexota bacterium]